VSRVLDDIGGTSKAGLVDAQEPFPAAALETGVQSQHQVAAGFSVTPCVGGLFGRSRFLGNDSNAAVLAEWTLAEGRSVRAEAAGVLRRWLRRR